MNSRTPPIELKKRPNDDSSEERPRKSPAIAAKDSSLQRTRKLSDLKFVKVENGSLVTDAETYRFRVLLTNGMTLELKMREVRKEMPIEEFLQIVKKKYDDVKEISSTKPPRREINWKYPNLHFTDANGKAISLKVNLEDYSSNSWRILRLYDGAAEPETYDDMWDLTPDTDLLKELPDEYTYETALADLIDNSLQALWSHRRGEKRLISVELSKNKISIFDSGPGMDGSDGKIVKWGKMGSSMNRKSRPQAVGGEPPYLMPFFGMFGYGGPVATMHLGERAVVSSKTTNCKMVYMLYLERDALINSSCPENSWRTKGGMRGPSRDENEQSPHGSFTKVEISDLKLKCPDAKLLQCRLKDIYFPYIQCDEIHGKTRRLVEFQVNGIDLAEIEGGEVATTNLHSCNGPDFILQLHLSFIQDCPPGGSQRGKTCLDANARLKCVYFPVVEGEESIDRIIKKLDEHGYGIRESYESFSRVSIRRLGRLLPHARWAWLPFMEPKQRKGERAQILKRCCFRVKCFVDTDSGFNPTPSKTDLAHQHPYTLALKNFGNSTPTSENEVQIEISRDGKKLNFSQLEKHYHDWLLEMHERYDEEIDSGLDEPTLVVVPSKDKKNGILADVVRVHKVIQRKGTHWKAGQKIKVLKGACVGCKEKNIFATIECFLLNGLHGEACGEARIICRPIEVPEDNGCSIAVDKIDIRRSRSFPISVIDSGKCLEIKDAEWNNKLEEIDQKLPSCIELLSSEHCKQLDIEGGMLKDIAEAGDAPPDQIVAVIRPKSFPKNSNSLDQKFILREKSQMILNVSFTVCDKNMGGSEHKYTTRIEPSSHKGFHGLYVFPVRSKMAMFKRAGFYTFSFDLDGRKGLHFEKVVKVTATAESRSWRVTSDDQNVRPTLRAGSFLPPLNLACYDRYDNTVPLESLPELTVELNSDGCVLAPPHKVKVRLTAEKSTMKLEDIFIRSRRLDKIRPDYGANLRISTPNGELSVDYPCRVIPGTPHKVTIHSKQLKRPLVPGRIIEHLELEVFDSCGNHAKEDEIISLLVDGFSFQDRTSLLHKIDAKGFVDLSNILKVSKGYGKDVYLSVTSGNKDILKLTLHTETRELRTATKVFEHCEAGSQLENIVFEVINSEGEVDTSIDHHEKHGQQPHTLTIKSESFDVDDSVRYRFRQGRCCIRAIPLPATEGIVSFTAFHSHYPELNMEIEVHVKKHCRENLANLGSPENIEKSGRENHGTIGSPENMENFEGSPQVSSGDSGTNDLEFSPEVPSSGPYVENFEFSPQLPSANPLEFLSPPSFKVREMGHESLSSQSLEGATLSVACTPSLKTPKPEDHNSHNENLEGRILALCNSDSENRGNSAGCSSVSVKRKMSYQELSDDLVRWSLKVRKRDDTLKTLELRRSTIELHVSNLQVSAQHNSYEMPSATGKESILKQIETRSECAAAVICEALKVFPYGEMTSDILGVVAVLGSVETVELSRMLAQYLGEDCMLAIVCKDYETADSLEAHTLHKFAAKLGRSINGTYQVLCLDNIISPIGDGSRRDPRDPLPLRNPSLPNGRRPQGFLGYAVNMINIEPSHLNWRSMSGHDLRQTLFYRLFGELQVYENRECLKLARSCIRDGAISLNGGIVRGNGLLSFGNWEPNICFPVRKLKPLSSRDLDTLSQMQSKQLELSELSRKIEEEKKLRKKEEEHVQVLLERYNNMEDGEI